MLLQWPDLYYHTSMDTIDKVSEDSLKRIGWIATVATLTLVNATAEEAFFLVSQTATKGMTRISETNREAVEQFFKKREEPRLKDKPEELAKELVKAALYSKNKIAHVVWREQEAARSVKRLGETPELNAFLDKYCADIANFGQKETTRLKEALNFVAKTSGVTLPAKLEETEAEAELKKLIPKKLFKGTLDTEVIKKALGERSTNGTKKLMRKTRILERKWQKY